MTFPRQWWRRAAATAKDKSSLCLSRITNGGRYYALAGSGGLRSAVLDAAVIRATSHDENSIDYKNAGRVFAWVRTSPSLLDPLMWTLARRVGRTRSWPVALKVLMLAHGLLLCSDDAPPDARLGRLPFDLSDFRDRSSHPSQSSGFSSFVRAYFHFLDLRSRAPSHETGDLDEHSDSDRDLKWLERLQALLHLLMQIRPYADGMEVSLILEAMDCTVIEIFEVYSGICNGIACFLTGILGPSAARKVGEDAKEEEARRRRRGAVGMRILRKAAEQSSQLSAYFEACRALGVLNAAEFPTVDRIPDEDIRDLERLVMGDISGSDEDEPEEAAAAPALLQRLSRTVVTKEWVVFDDGADAAAAAADPAQGHSGNGNWETHSGNGKWNPFLGSPERPLPTLSWAATVNQRAGIPTFGNGNLIELL